MFSSLLGTNADNKFSAFSPHIPIIFADKMSMDLDVLVKLNSVLKIATHDKIISLNRSNKLINV